MFSSNISRCFHTILKNKHLYHFLTKIEYYFKKVFKELKRKAFGFLGDHWFAIFVILVVGFILLAPKLIFNGFSSDTEEQIYTEKPKLKTDDQKHIKKPAIFDISTQLEGRTTNAKNSATYHRGRFDSNSKRSLRPEDSL